MRRIAPLVAFFIGCALTGGAQAQMRGPRLAGVTTDTEAVLLNIPEVVCPALVSTAEWSPNGQYVLAAREYGKLPPAFTVPPVTQVTLILWERETGRTRELWKATTNREPAHVHASWLPGTSTALVVTEQAVEVRRPDQPQPIIERQRSLARVDARRGLFTPLARLPERTQLIVSPAKPVALIYGYPDRAVRLLKPDGTIRQVVPLPAELEVQSAYWAGSGSVAVLQAIEKTGEGVRARAVLLDADTGRLRRPATDTKGQPTREQAAEMAPAAAAQRQHAIRIAQSSASLKQGPASEGVRPLWLETTEPSDQSRALIAADGDWARIAPTGDAVLYSSGGTAFVSTFARLPKEAFIAARNAAQRAVTMSRMKQVGTAVMMWSQDYDERLPQAGEDVMGMLLPYVKNEDVFQGLVYTYSGGPLSDVKEPARTLLGYAPGPGGRANLFVDGHVEWQPDQR